MKRRKSKLKKKINPEKSNKMIWAVTAGLVILFGGLLWVITGNDSVTDRAEQYRKTLKYMQKTEGITHVESDPDTGSVTIFIEPDPNSRSRIDYKKISVFAGIKLSNQLKGEKILFRLIRNPGEKTELSFTVLNGEVIRDSSSR